MNKPRENPMELSGRIFFLTTIEFEIYGGSRYPFCVIVPCGTRGENMWQTHTRAWTGVDWDNPRHENSQN